MKKRTNKKQHKNHGRLSLFGCIALVITLLGTTLCSCSSTPKSPSKNDILNAFEQSGYSILRMSVDDYSGTSMEATWGITTRGTYMIGRLIDGEKASSDWVLDSNIDNESIYDKGTLVIIECQKKAVATRLYDVTLNTAKENIEENTQYNYYVNYTEQVLGSEDRDIAILEYDVSIEDEYDVIVGYTHYVSAYLRVDNIFVSLSLYYDTNENYDSKGQNILKDFYNS